MSAALVRMLREKYAVDVVGVMDDFNIMKSDQEGRRSAWLGACTDLQRLGFVLSQGPGKTEPPAQQKVSLGLEIDSVRMTVGLCSVKLQKLATVCSDIVAAATVTKKQLERLLGFLMWANLRQGGLCRAHLLSQPEACHAAVAAAPAPGASVCMDAQ